MLIINLKIERTKYCDVGLSNFSLQRTCWILWIIQSKIYCSTELGFVVIKLFSANAGDKFTVDIVCLFSSLLSKH